MYRRYWDEMPCYLSIHDRDFRIIEGNRRFREDFGERIGQYCYKVYKGRDEICPNCPVEATFEDGKNHPSEQLLTTGSGRQVPVMVHTTPIRNAVGEVVAVMEMHTEIDEVKKLQEELGTSLFEVVGREGRFTAAGRMVLDYARRISALEKEMEGEISGIAGLVSGEVSIGTIDAASIYILPAVYSSFSRKYPGIDLQVDVSPTLPLVERMLDGRLDFVVGTLTGEKMAGVEEKEIFREKLIPIAPPGHPAAAKRGVDVESFAGYPFISFHRESLTRRDEEYEYDEEEGS